MIARKATLQNLEDALIKVNEKYAGNIIWKRSPDKNGKGYKFTLTVKSSRDKGGRLGQSGLMGYSHNRYVAAACWHVHGDFFDALFSLAPESYVWSGGRKITKTEGNWQDRNIGSMTSPVMYSDACECNGAYAEVK